MKKQILAAGILTAVGVTGLAGIGIAHAATDSTNSNRSSLVDAVSAKFGLDKSKVQTVFDEQRTARQAERATEVKNDIAQLVKDGKLTQTQADAINAKRAELLKEREAHRAEMIGKTDTERKAERDEHKAALESWMKEKGISSDYAYLFMGGGGRGHGQGGGMHSMRGNN